MNLFKKIAQFTKSALIISDMAKRIMYSLIPSVNNNQIDYKALKYAVEGISDILKFGAEACKDEMLHILDKADYYIDQFSALNKEDYISIFDLCIKGFSDTDHWAYSYGGYEWEKIARSLKSLAIIKNGMVAAKKENNLQLELDFMKQGIIELNIFDRFNS